MKHKFELMDLFDITKHGIKTLVSMLGMAMVALVII